MHTLTEPVNYVQGHEPSGYIFGSGPMKFNEEQSSYGYGKFVREILSDNADYVQIAHTQSAQLLYEPEFHNIINEHLINTLIEDGYHKSINEAFNDGLMGYRDKDGEMQLGLWDAVSLGFAENAHGYIVTITPWADNERIFVRTELPALLKNERVETINGHPREEFVEAFNDYVADGLSEEDAYAKLNQTLVMGSSYEFIRNYSEDFAEDIPPHLHHDFRKISDDDYGEWAAKAQIEASPDRTLPRSTQDFGYGNLTGVQQLGGFEAEEAAL